MVPSCVMHTPHQLCDPGFMLCMYQGQLVLPVLQCLPVSCERDGLWARDRNTCRSLLVRRLVLVLFVDKYVPSIYVKLMYIWAMLLTGQGLSVGCPAGTLAYFCQWVLLHCWLTLTWCSCKMSSLLGRYDCPRCYRPIPLSVWWDQLM